MTHRDGEQTGASLGLADEKTAVYARAEQVLGLAPAHLAVIPEKKKDRQQFCNKSPLFVGYNISPSFYVRLRRARKLSPLLPQHVFFTFYVRPSR